ncbi:MAG TPA: hypothetical protein VMB72_07350, partial [Acidimicrobiales bacterium]|nr:hypothetical protein [Acidimicrobiales bacterium]
MAERQQGTGTRSSPVLHYEFWLDDSHPGDVRVEHLPVSGDDGAASRVPRRRAVATAVAALVVVAAAVPLALALRSASSPTGPHVTESPARRHVLAALDATVASGSFDISYSEQPTT